MINQWMMIVRRTLLLPSILSLVLCHAGQGQVKSQDASIGVWPWLVGNIDAYQTEIVDKAKSTGLDTIYLSVWRTTGTKTGNLYMVDEAKTWSTTNGKLIPRVTVSGLIQKAHAAGLQVVLVLKVFGSPTPLPSDYGHQDFLIEKVIRYLVHSYDSSGRQIYQFDGLALDYIRWFGGSHTTLEVNRFIDAMRKEVGPLPIHAYVIAGAYALDGGTYNNTFRSYSGLMSYVASNYGQHWEELAARIDVLMPMTYTANGHVYGNNLTYMEGYVRQAAKYARAAVNAVKSKCRVVLAIRTWNSTGQTTTQATVEASCRGALSGGADGFMAFRYFTARGHSTWFKGLQNFSEPGPDLPIANVTAQPRGIQALIDSTASLHARFATSQLRARLDLNGDGKFEIASHVPTSALHTMPFTGRHHVWLEVTDPRGHTGFATARVDLTVTLTPLLARVSAANGGTVAMQLAVGPAQQGRRYIVFGSLAGTTPGTPLGGTLVVPLNIGPLTTLIYGSLNTPMFANFAGTLNSQGTATPTFNVPKNAIPWVFIGSKLYFAAVGIHPTTSAPLFATNPITVTILK